MVEINDQPAYKRSKTSLYALVQVVITSQRLWRIFQKVILDTTTIKAPVVTRVFSPQLEDSKKYAEVRGMCTT